MVSRDRYSRNESISQARGSQKKERSLSPAAIQGPRIALLLITLALICFGVVMGLSAGSIEAISDNGNVMDILIEQLGFLAIGTILLFVLWKIIPYTIFNGPFAYLVWFLSFGLIVLTAVMGSVGLGAQRWLQLGPISMQPSEFAKIGFIITAAYLYCCMINSSKSFVRIMAEVILGIIVPMLMILIYQSDLGTTIIIAVGVISVLWLGEAPKKWIYIILISCVIVAIASIVLKGYRSDRFAYLDPWNDGDEGYGSGYQIIRSYYAFADGGIFGVGLGNSREKYAYLPEAETDFIFAIIAEELGLVGCVVIIALFISFLVAGLRIARMAPDPFGVMLSGSCTIVIVFQAFLNIACVIGWLPTTGKPLPFISSGGSSLIASMIMVGLILSVSAGTERGDVYKKRRDDLVYTHRASSKRR